MKKVRLLKTQYKSLKVKVKRDRSFFSVQLRGLLGDSDLSYGGVPSENWLVFGSKRCAKSFFPFLKQESFGISFGFYVKMYLQGVGYRVWSFKNKLLFKLGYNHLIKFTLPTMMKVYGKKYRFLIFGMYKEEVNRMARRLQWLRKPDSYKGKGVRYSNVFIELKETKDAKKK